MKTVLLVDDDPLQARVRRSILGRGFPAVERAADAAEAFIRIEDPGFRNQLGLVIVGLIRPGLGSPAFVAELTSRFPSVPVLVLGQGSDGAVPGQSPSVRFLYSASPEQMLATSRQMVEQKPGSHIA